MTNSSTGSCFTNRSARPAVARSTPDFLESVYGKLRRSANDPDAARRALEALFLGLQERKMNCSPQAWEESVQECRSHMLMGLMHEDPFTSRAFTKPRGYAGDAVLLDYIYGREERWAPPHCTRIGKCIFDYTTLAPASSGVRARRGYIAGFIDRLADEVFQPDILSIAAGHLREAELIASVKRGKLGQFVALDADPSSLREVRRCYGSYGVQTVHAGFRDLIKNCLKLGSFDAVYTTGLFDYVGQAAGRRLVQTMFHMLRPGGRLIVANFLPSVRDIGFMETYMDWHLIYRTRQEMVDLTLEIPQQEMDRIEVFAEENQNIVFLEVTRSSS